MLVRIIAFVVHKDIIIREVLIRSRWRNGDENIPDCVGVWILSEYRRVNKDIVIDAACHEGNRIAARMGRVVDIII